MNTVCVVGAQWGDEGKAGIVDLLAADAAWVVRFQGGPNAGHTVVVGDEVYKLHLVPSGIVRPGMKCLVGQGVVVDLDVLFRELSEVESRGISSAGRMFVSDRAHLILPYHRVLDGLKESASDQKIGTTKRGIGPCYADKVSYRGIRVADLMDPARFATRLRSEVMAKNRLITEVYGAAPLSFDEIHDAWCAHRERLAPMVVDGGRALQEAMGRGEGIVFEGAQGFLLDVDAGTYPYVTGSNASALGLAAGAGIPPRAVDRVIAVAKAYCTRVGEGPFPTEDLGELGDALRERGQEFGTTTGRPRRCGWFDAVAVRYAARTSGLDELAITKLDILTGVETLRVAVAYEHRGERIDTVPADVGVMEELTPVYREFPGFAGGVAEARAWDDLPAEARAFLDGISDILSLPIRLVSVGPERNQVVRRD